MKFFAKVRIKDNINAHHLINAFFKEFNQNSSIQIKGKEAIVEIIFDAPPKEVVSAIGHCEILEFKYGTLSGEYEKDDNNAVEESEPEVVEEEATEESEPEVVEEEATEESEPEVVEEETTTKSYLIKNKDNEIPELTEIAKKSTTFKEFVNSVGTWLELGKRHELFVQMVNVAKQTDRVTRENIETILNSKGIVCNEYNRICLGKNITEKFKGSENNVTLMKLIKIIVAYQTFNFPKEFAETKAVEELTTSAEEESINKLKEDVPKTRVRMKCLPEIPYFEEILGSVDKTQAIEDRVRYVLNAMGFKNQTYDQQQAIFKMTNTAVRLGKMTFPIIFLKCGIAPDDLMNARMTLSEFINNFVSQYAPNNKVKLLDFLKDLQEIIMFDSEIESFEDFAD